MTTFNDDASATIFLDLDSSASLSLSLDTNATLGDFSKETDDTQAQISGCIGVNGGMSVNAGAEGSFFDLFDNTTQVALLSKNIQLFQVSEPPPSMATRLRTSRLRNASRIQNLEAPVHLTEVVALRDPGKYKWPLFIP